MTEQSANSQDSARVGWQHTPLAANAVSIGPTDIRATRKEVCPECGERVHSQMESCPACGESLARTPKQLRCMHCHTTASSELVICPGCGRELRAAPPKLVTIGAPALVALLLVTLLVTQWQRISPIAWARTNLMRGVVMVENMSASIEPEVVIVMTPIVPEGGEGAVVEGDPQAVAIAASVVTPLPDPNASQGTEQSILAASVVQEPPFGVGGPQPEDDNVALSVAAEALATEPPPTDTPLPPPTQFPSPTPLPTDTPPPPTATLALTDAPTVEATVAKAGGMAAALASTESLNTPTPTWTVVADISSERSSAASESADGEVQVAALAASETTLPTPTATPTVVMTPLPTATPTPVIYQVRAGDTLVTIAAAYEVDVEELMAANDISEQDVYVIQPGQMLVVPIPTPAPLAVGSGDLSAVRLETPALVVPSDGATVGCATGGKLIWQRVQFVKDSDRYLLHLGFVNGRSRNGQESVTWVLAQSSPVTQTEWQLDTALCDLAPADYERQWRWWVEVVDVADGETISVSPPSKVWGFTWE